MNKSYIEYNSGVYIIRNILNNKILVGYTSNFTKRKSWHFNHLKAGIHPNQHLQNAVSKYGIENFTFEILEEYPRDKEILSSMENYWCNLLDTHNREHGYNLQPTRPDYKVIHTPETLLKMSKANKGKRWNNSRKEDFSKFKQTQNWKPTLQMVENSKSTCSKPILQIDSGGRVVEHPSLMEAARITGYGRKYIKLCCHNKQNRYKDYIWKFKVDENKN